MEHADILIVGGGATGLALALALRRMSRRGLSVLLFDPALGRRGGGPRSTALAAGPVTMLRNLGVWDSLEAQAQPISRMEIAENRHGELAAPSLSFGGGGENASLGYMLFLKDIEQSLRDACDAEGVQMRAEPIDGVGVDAASATATSKSGAWRARLVVGADGARSVASGAAGVAVREWSYGRSAVVVTLEHDRAHQGVAAQSFLPDGPLAVLPMAGQRSSVVWTHQPEVARAFAAHPDDLRSALEEFVAPRLGAFRLADAPAAFPLSFRIASRFTGERIALVGDAAHRVHPLAGQGLNLGLRDVAVLTEIILAAGVDGLDYGSAHALRRYDEARKFDVLTSGLAFDLLHRIFTPRTAPAVMARRLALQATDGMWALKRFLEAEAAGLAGASPALFRSGR